MGLPMAMLETIQFTVLSLIACSLLVWQEIRWLEGRAQIAFYLPFVSAYLVALYTYSFT